MSNVLIRISKILFFKLLGNKTNKNEIYKNILFFVYLQRLNRVPTKPDMLKGISQACIVTFEYKNLKWWSLGKKSWSMFINFFFQISQMFLFVLFSHDSFLRIRIIVHLVSILLTNLKRTNPSEKITYQ